MAVKGVLADEAVERAARLLRETTAPTSSVPLLRSVPAGDGADEAASSKSARNAGRAAVVRKRRRVRGKAPM